MLSSPIDAYMHIESSIVMLQEYARAAAPKGVTNEINLFLLLSFLPLPVISEIRVTDSGLFDVVEFVFIDVLDIC